MAAATTHQPSLFPDADEPPPASPAPRRSGNRATSRRRARRLWRSRVTRLDDRTRDCGRRGVADARRALDHVPPEDVPPQS